MPTNMVHVNQWLTELQAQIAAQPGETWTVARMKLVYPDSDSRRGTVGIDTVSAAGACNATATNALFNEALGRITIQATFSNFELRGESKLIGPFRILLQNGKSAIGRFRQRYAHELWPISGEWEVPFRVESALGALIPRPSEPPVLLKSAEPGEFAIPPIGSWFEKWDPISLVDENDPEGPTIAIVEHAMHVMLNIGSAPAIPAFYSAGKW